MTVKKGCNNSWTTGLNTLWYVVFRQFFSSYYFLEFPDFFSRIYITLVEGNIMTTLQPIQISIRIYGWRQNCLVDPIEIRYMISLILQSRACGRLRMFQSLDTCNRFQALKFRSSRRF